MPYMYHLKTYVNLVIFNVKKHRYKPRNMKLYDTYEKDTFLLQFFSHCVNVLIIFIALS